MPSLIRRLVYGVLFCLLFGPLGLLAQSARELRAKELYYEQKVNNRTYGSFQIDLPSGFPEQYDPLKETSFDIGYLEIPFEALQHWHSDDFRGQAMEMLLVSRHDGVKWRFFIHPLSETYYEKLIHEYGPLKKGEYRAYSKASFRTLVIEDIKDPSKQIELKVSLDQFILGLTRVVDRKELYRSFILNKVIREIPQQILQKYRMNFIYEDLQVVDPQTGTGFLMKMDPRFENDRRVLIPATAIFSREPGERQSMLANWIRKSKGRPVDFIKERILRPLYRAIIYMSYQEGLVGQPHPQNIVFALVDGKLQDQVFIRDLEAFRPDPEMRTLLGKTNEYFFETDRPAEDLFLYGFDYFEKHGVFTSKKWRPQIAAVLQELGYKRNRAISVAEQIVEEVLLEQIEEQLNFTKAQVKAAAIPAESVLTTTARLQKARLAQGSSQTYPVLDLLRGWEALKQTGHLISERPPSTSDTAELVGREVLAIRDKQGRTRSALLLHDRIRNVCAALLPHLANGWFHSMQTAR